MAIFPLYSETATQTIVVEAATSEIKVGARAVDLNCVGGSAFLVSLQKVPVGTVFTLTATDLDTDATGSLSSITLLTKAGKTIIFDAENDKITLMSLPENEFAIMGATDGVVFAGNTGVTGTITS